MAEPREFIWESRQLVKRGRVAWSGDGCSFSVYADRLIDATNLLEEALKENDELRQRIAELEQE